MAEKENPSENKSEVKAKNAKSRKKRAPLILRIFGGILIFVLTIVIVLAAYLAYSALDKKDSLEAVPAGGGIFLHTDRLYDAVIPLLDLRAADVVFAENKFAGYRGAFMELRASKILKSPLVRFLANRRVDASLYSDGKFVAVADLSFVSAATRLLPFAGPRLLQSVPQLKNFSYIRDGIFKMEGEGGSDGSAAIMFGFYKNLLVVSGDADYFTAAMALNNLADYSEKHKALIAEKSDEPFKIITNAAETLSLMASSDEISDLVLPLLAPKSESVVLLGINDDEFSVKAEFPLQAENSPSPLAPVITKDSTLPALLAKLSDRVQYYTLLNAGTLPELKEVAFPMLRNSGTDVDSIWQKANSLCKMLFKTELDELIFSWTGKEFAVFGMEGMVEPVFAVQVADEAQRDKMFDALTSSFVLNENTAVLVGGMRLPYLEIPPFLRGILSLFKIELPKPYYLVKDGFLYLSESPQNLAAVYAATETGEVLAGSEKFRQVSEGMAVTSTAALYYDLARSIPFFLQNESLATKILALYNIGRADFSVKDGRLCCSLHACAIERKDSRLLPGFPFAFSGMPDGNLVAEVTESGKRPSAVFWSEEMKSIHALDLGSMQHLTYELPGLNSICATRKSHKNKGVLWAITDDGALYLFDSELKVIEGYPKLLGIKPSAPISVAELSSASGGASLYIPCSDGTIVRYANGKTENVYAFEDDDVNFKSAVATFRNCGAVYSKGFIGKIYTSADGADFAASEPFEIDGIAFGSPCIGIGAEQTRVAFVTQNGTFNLFDFYSHQSCPGFPLELDAVFFTNAVYSGGYYFALSADACLYRIGNDGSVLSVKVPDASSAEHGTLCAVPGGVALCADSNVLWAFTAGLEIMQGFPVAGFGNPVLADVNGDNEFDCITISRDKNIFAWNLK